MTSENIMQELQNKLIGHGRNITMHCRKCMYVW